MLAGWRAGRLKRVALAGCQLSEVGQLMAPLPTVAALMYPHLPDRLDLVSPIPYILLPLYAKCIDPWPGLGCMRYRPLVGVPVAFESFVVPSVGRSRGVSSWVESSGFVAWWIQCPILWALCPPIFFPSPSCQLVAGHCCWLFAALRRPWLLAPGLLASTPWPKQPCMVFCRTLVNLSKGFSHASMV